MGCARGERSGDDGAELAYGAGVTTGFARVAVIAFGTPVTLALSSGSRKKSSKPQPLNFAAV